MTTWQPIARRRNDRRSAWIELEGAPLSLAAGFTVARTCAQAEQFFRAGLRPGQRLEITECRPFLPGDWRPID
jgi:hypothetical protein